MNTGILADDWADEGGPYTYVVTYRDGDRETVTIDPREASRLASDSDVAGVLRVSGFGAGRDKGA